jgi:long-chain acyl-CoA synthetase
MVTSSPAARGDAARTRVGRHNLARLAETVQERRGDYRALLFEDTWHTSAALHERATRIAGGMIELGLAPGDRVFVMARNCPEVLLAYQAAWRAGAAVAPSIFMLSEREVEHVLRDSGARLALVEPELLAKVGGAAARAGSDARLVALGPEADGGAIQFSELAAAAPAAIVPRADEDLAALLYTGGTTGRAKGVMLSHANLWHAGRGRAELGYVEGFDRTIVALPLSHTFGVMVTVSDMHWPSRRVAALMRWFDAETWLLLAERLQVTDATLVPAMMQALLAQPLERRDLGALRSVVCGSAPLPPPVFADFQQRLPWAELREGYGLTEASAMVSGTPPGGVRPGSVGVPAPGVEVEIRDGADAVPAGELGELCTRSPSVMLGYWEDPEATAEVLRDGWLHTGDVARRDEDGYLHIVDRRKDLIIRGGFNVYPRDVEEAMLAHPDLVEAAVVGRPDEARGEEIVAFVLPRPGASPVPVQLVAWAREQIGGYKYPREVHVTEALPRTSIGKVDRRRLRELAAAADARRNEIAERTR